MESILIDTCMWAQHFKRPQGGTHDTIRTLLLQDRVILVGPVVTEVLIGFRRHDQAAWASSVLKAVRLDPLLWKDWKEAAELGRQQIANGNELPLTDLVVVAVAQDRGYAVYSDDPHFDLFPELKRFTPE